MSAFPATPDTAYAFAPGNISGLFKIIPHDNPAKMHSLGWGFTVSDGVTVQIRRAQAISERVGFNDDLIRFPTVTGALRRISDTPLSVSIASSLPLSSGFGLSGAATFAALIAANHLLQLGKSRKELAMIAHISEVENLTGLGDVCSQYNGGCLVKTVAGHPLAATHIDMHGIPVHWRYFGKIPTSEILADEGRHQRINSAADRALDAIQDALRDDAAPSFSRLVALALEFARASGLLMDVRVKDAIAQAEANGGAATMIMLGDAVFSTAPFPGSSRTMLSTRPAQLIDTD